jgi:hypothetical protein
MNTNPPALGRCGAGAQQPADGGQMSVVTASAGIGPGRRPFGEVV